MYIGFDWDSHRVTGAPPRQDRAGVGGDQWFGSAHPGSMNAAMCDGSVRRINYSIDGTLWRNLGHKDSILYGAVFEDF